MMPTADQAAKIIVLACRAVHVDPLDINRRTLDGRSFKAQRQRLARAYAALAMREIFPRCTSIAIGRMVGASEPAAYFGRIWTARAKGELRDFDPEVLQRIVRDAGMRIAVVEQKVVDEDPPGAGREPAQEAAAETPIDLPPILTGAQRPPATGPITLSPKPFDQRYGSVRFGVKKRLEDELRQAVLNTGGRIEK